MWRCEQKTCVIAIDPTKTHLEESIRSKLGLAIVTGLDLIGSSLTKPTPAPSALTTVGTNSATNGFKLAGGNAQRCVFELF